MQNGARQSLEADMREMTSIIACPSEARMFGEFTKSHEEISLIAKLKDARQVPDLSLRDLKVLFFKLNRTRYGQKEQDEFIRFFLVVHRALTNKRKAETVPSL